MDYFFVYFFLRAILLFILIVTGYFISQKQSIDQRNYWILSILAMIIYSLIEGLRYNRGTDYTYYKEMYEYALNLKSYMDIDSVEPMIGFINKPFRYIGLSYPYIFVFYSFILIFAGFFFIEKNHRVALFAIPMFFMSTIVQSENLVRQFIAFSFVLLLVNYFLTNRWIKFCMLMLMAYLTHTSSIIFLPFFFLIKYVKNPFGNLLAIIVLYITSWLWKPEYWGNFVQYFQMIQLDDFKYSGYIDNADDWFSGEKLLDFNVSTFSLVRLFLFNTGIIILGYRILEKYRDTHYPFFYFLFVFGAIFQRYTDQMELLYRIDLYFYMFWFIVLAYITYDTFYSESKNTDSKFICYFLIFNVLYDFLIPHGEIDPLKYLFIWN